MLSPIEIDTIIEKTGTEVKNPFQGYKLSSGVELSISDVSEINTQIEKFYGYKAVKKYLEIMGKSLGCSLFGYLPKDHEDLKHSLDILYLKVYNALCVESNKNEREQMSAIGKILGYAEDLDDIFSSDTKSFSNDMSDIENYLDLIDATEYDYDFDYMGEPTKQENDYFDDEDCEEALDEIEEMCVELNDVTKEVYKLNEISKEEDDTSNIITKDIISTTKEAVEHLNNLNEKAKIINKTGVVASSNEVIKNLKEVKTEINKALNDVAKVKEMLGIEQNDGVFYDANDEEEENVCDTKTIADRFRNLYNQKSWDKNVKKIKVLMDKDNSSKEWAKAISTIRNNWKANHNE